MVIGKTKITQLSGCYITDVTEPWEKCTFCPSPGQEKSGTYQGWGGTAGCGGAGVPAGSPVGSQVCLQLWGVSQVLGRAEPVGAVFDGNPQTARWTVLSASQ